MNREIEAICEKLEWTIHESNEYAELEKYSPAGEDFIFGVETVNFVEAVKEYAAEFNLDEHIEMWIEARCSGAKGIPPTRELVKDAEDIEKMLHELAAALSERNRNNICIR